MKRICLFAGYDSNNIIHDYVVYYLKELSTVADVYYMADNEISDEEKEKIAPYVKGAYGYKHGKYDFGSWQELIKIIGWGGVAEYDELILANDSVFGPLYPMKKLFEKLEQDRQWDICGINKNNYLKWHLSSYFLVFKKKAFINDIFINHINSVTFEAKNTHVIDKYEVPFMEKFYNNNYNVKVLMKHVGIDNNKWKEYIINGMPFIKKKAFFECISYKDIEGWKDFIIQNSTYPVELMESYLGNIDKYVKKKQLKSRLKKFRKNFIRINIKKDRIKINLFGVTLIKKEKTIQTYATEICPIYEIKQQGIKQ